MPEYKINIYDTEFSGALEYVKLVCARQGVDFREIFPDLPRTYRNLRRVLREYSIGFERDIMPQLPKNYSPKVSKMLARDLMPIQSDIFLDKIISDQYPIDILDAESMPALYATSENFVLDGHHRWARCMLFSPMTNMNVIGLPYSLDNIITGLTGGDV